MQVELLELHFWPEFHPLKSDVEPEKLIVKRLS